MTIVFRKAEDGTVIDRLTRRVGFIPIMVSSVKCNLHKLSPKELVKRNEEEYELGGYFIVNGNEKVKIEMKGSNRLPLPSLPSTPSFSSKNFLVSFCGGKMTNSGGFFFSPVCA